MKTKVKASMGMTVCPAYTYIGDKASMGMSVCPAYDINYL
jgi:hypothetical protein